MVGHDADSTEGVVYVLKFSFLRWIGSTRKRVCWTGSPKPKSCALFAGFASIWWHSLEALVYILTTWSQATSVRGGCEPWKAWGRCSWIKSLACHSLHWSFSGQKGKEKGKRIKYKPTWCQTGTCTTILIYQRTFLKEQRHKNHMWVWFSDNTFEIALFYWQKVWFRG